MKVLITGGAGFIGSSLSEQLVNSGHEITIVDNLSTGNKSNLKDLDMYYYNMDLSNIDNLSLLDHLIKTTDVCYHLAASIGVKLILENPAKALSNSTQINDNLFPLFEKYKTRVIFASTSEVYGETKSSNGSTETDKLEILPGIRGSYACSKLMAEFSIKSYSFPSTIVRFFNVVGPKQVGTFGHVLPKFIKSAKSNLPLKIYDDGKQVRSFCDIRDAVNMLEILLDETHINQTYNVGNSENVSSIYDLACTVKQILQSTSELEFINLNKALGDTAEDITIRFPNTSKISQYYVCKYTLNNIIENILKD